MSRGLTRSLLLLVALAAVALANIPNSIVLTQYGPVQGYVDLFSGVQTWRGIPFAAPPVGDNRLRAPQPATPWPHVRPALTQAQICTQLHLIGGIELGGEDCLYLDVYVPPGTAADAKLPVLVWIFGGGYSLGDGYEFGFYDGTNFVKRTDAIIVTPNYRVSSLGFLATPEMQAEDPNGSTGNYGLQDQTAALQWVATNIGAFGGDPARVTIYGESAGAFSVCWHLVSPQSSGLFRAAIMESGTCDASEFFVSAARSFPFSHAWTASVGCDRQHFPSAAAYMSCVRALSASALMSGSVNATTPQSPLSPIMPWGPTIDGSSHGLLRRPIVSIRRGAWNKVPLIIGTNNDEGTIFVPIIFLVVPGTHFPLQEADFTPVLMHFFDQNASLVAAVERVYPNDGTLKPDARAGAILRDCFFACPSRRVARALSDQGNPAYLYHFTYKADWIDYWLLGDYHASELVFVFDNPFPLGLRLFSANDQQMADIFRAYWSNFATHLSPNGAASVSSEAAPSNATFSASAPPVWPQYQTATDQNIVLELPPTVQSGLYGSACDFWDSVADDDMARESAASSSSSSTSSARASAFGATLRSSLASERTKAILAALNADPEIAAAARLDPKQRAAQRVQVDWRAKLTALSERLNQQ